MSFQPDKNSEISKTQLYAHYQHIAKIKGWTVLTIPTFFEILKWVFLGSIKFERIQSSPKKLLLKIYSNNRKSF